jgi:hypothetical protein
MSDLLVIFVKKSPEIVNTDRKIATLSQSIQSEAAIRMGNIACLVQQLDSLHYYIKFHLMNRRWILNGVLNKKDYNLSVVLGVKLNNC